METAIEAAVEPTIYRVPEQNLATLQARITKLAKRAKKLNVPAPSLFTVSVEEVRKRNEISGVTTITIIHHVTVTGEAPKIAGWSFAAILQPTVDESGATTGNLLRVIPGFEQSIPVQYRAAGNNCDHCHTSRRRNETFVLVNDAGEWKQVGRNCLRDFLGHVSPDAYASWAEILIDAADLAGMAEDEGFGGARRIERFEAEEILALGAACIRLYGFRSNKTAQEFGGQSTSGNVAEWINSSDKQREKWEHPLIVEDVDREQAATVFEWMHSLSSRPELNDYFYNLSILGQGATFTARNFGLAISAIATWAKELEFEINRKKRFAEDNASEFVGVVEERGKFENLTLVYTQTFESDFGVSTLYKFKSPEGNVIVAFSTVGIYIPKQVPTQWGIRWQKSEIEVGDVLTVAGSVTAHDIRDGVKQTKITRAKRWEPKVKTATPTMMRQIAWA